jgi:hypothetical protein
VRRAQYYAGFRTNRTTLAAEALIIEQRSLRVAWVDQFTRYSPDVTRGAHAHEKPRHVPLAQTSIERALKIEMPVHGLYRCIKSGLLTDPSESISRGPAILPETAGNSGRGDSSGSRICCIQSAETVLYLFSGTHGTQQVVACDR